MAAVKLRNRVIVDPDILAGKPIIKGTRISVEFVLGLLAQGMSTEEILKAYPHLEKQDIKAALEYASDVLEDEKVFPLTVSSRRK